MGSAISGLLRLLFRQLPSVKTAKLSAIGQTFLRVFAVAIPSVALVSLTFAQNTGLPPDPRLHRSVPAGPYSQVETAFGGLTTTFPTVHLKGIGHTSVDVDLVHRSNMVNNTSFVPQPSSPGAGWHLDTEDDITFNLTSGVDPNGHAAFTRLVAGDAVEWWDYDYNGSTHQYINVHPFSGTRQNIYIEQNPTTHVVTGFILTDEHTLNRTYYEYVQTVGAQSWYWRSKVVDTYGNQVTYAYELDPSSHVRLDQITDASGRTVSFNYTKSTPYLLHTIVLNTGTANRSWQLYNAIQGFLGAVYLPSVTVNGVSSTPFAQFWYYNSTAGTNISEVEDPKGNLWIYGYSTLTSFSPPCGVLNPLVCSSVSHPTMSLNGVYNGPGSTGYYDPYDPMTFNWVSYTDLSNPGLSLYACIVGTPYGSWSNWTGPPYRYSAVIYYRSYPSNPNFPLNPTNPSYQTPTLAYFTPLYQVIDPNVAADGQGGQSPTGPFNGYHETHYWNLSDFTLATQVDRRGYATTWTYPTSGFLANTGLPGARFNPDGYVDQYFYDTSYRLIETIDNMNMSIGGDRTLYTYNGSSPDIALKCLNPDATTQAQIYPNVAPGAINGQNFGTYNPTNPLTIETAYTYNPNGTMATEQLGGDNATQYTSYDSYGNPQTKITPSGNTWQYRYDTLDNRTQEIPPSGGPAGTTTWSYDEWNRHYKTTFADSTTEQIIYDNDSNATQVTDENGHVLKEYYDPVNRLYSTDQQTDSNSAHDIVTQFAFDEAGDKFSVKNGNGNQTTNLFDERHYNTQVQYPDGTSRSVHFDGNGNIDVLTDGRGYVTDRVYDSMNRVTQKYFATDGRTVQESYRGDGLRYQMTDTRFPSATWTWSYNGAKLLNSDYQPVPAARVSYSYYSGTGRRNTMSVGSETWTYDFDTAGRPSNVQQSLGDPTPVVYTATGAPGYNADDDSTSETFYNNWRSTFAYDSRRRVSSMTHDFFNGSNWATQTSLTYGRDNVGNIRSEFRTQGSGSLSANFNYDYADRLIGDVRTVGGSWPSGLAYNIQYQYDGDGNRTQVTRNGVPSTVYCDANDKFTSGDGWSMSSYDGDGNPGSITGPNGSYTFSYDQEDKVTEYSSTFQVSYLWDGDGRLAQKSSTQSGNTTTQVFDGDAVIAVQAGTNTTYRLPGVCEYSTSTGSQSYQMEDKRGSAIGETIGASYSGQYSFDGYGVEGDITSVPGGSTLFRFAGKKGYESDADNGLVLCGARFYLPVLGRFLTQDPIGQDGGLNLYEYCADNPLNLADPSGRAPDIDSINATISAAMRQATTHPRDAYEMLKDLYQVDGLAIKTRALIMSRMWQVRIGILLEQTHHYLPQQFRDFFEEKGLDVEEYTGRLNAEWHRIIHGKYVEGLNYGPYYRATMEDWNGRWAQWIGANQNASREQILDHMRVMATDFRIPQIGPQVGPRPGQ